MMQHEYLEQLHDHRVQQVTIRYWVSKPVKCTKLKHHNTRSDSSRIAPARIHPNYTWTKIMANHTSLVFHTQIISHTSTLTPISCTQTKLSKELFLPWQHHS